MNNDIRDLRQFAISQGTSGNTFDEYQKYNFKSSYINPSVVEERQLNVTSIDVFSRLLMDRIIFLGTQINDDVANIITAQMLWLEQQGNTDIQLFINTPGGSVYSGYGIVDCMNFIRPDVSTTIVGLAASMGAVISSSGVKGKRYALPHSRFMIHQPLSSLGQMVQASDIEIQSNEINKLKKELYETLSENSGLTYEKIEKMADRDNFMTVKEAIENGFVDSVVVRNTV
jgi:ATP-dependent Clp protease protease subunit